VTKPRQILLAAGHWSAKIEYDYLCCASQSIAATAPVGAPGSVDLNIQRITAGLNYRF